MTVKFKRFSSHARVPEKSTLGPACFDNFSARSVTIKPNKTRSIETDIGLKFSNRYACRLYPRSGLSLKEVILGCGLIDSDFSGNVSVILTNLSEITIEIETGDSIGQMLFLKKEEVKFGEVDERDETERGVKGFGSTGKQIKKKKMAKVVIEEFDACH